MTKTERKWWIVESSKQVLNKLQKMGAEIVDITIPQLNALSKAHAITITSEMSLMVRSWLSDPTNFGDDTRLVLDLMKYLDGADYLSAQKIRTFAMETFSRLFTQVDVIATPSLAIVAPLIPANGEVVSDVVTTGLIMRYQSLANFVGIPAISIPVSYTSKNLPIAFQFMANHYDESLLLRLSLWADTEFSRQKPQLHYDAPK